MTKRQVSIALDRALLARLDAECQQQDRSRSYLAREALRLWLHRQAEHQPALLLPSSATAVHQTEPAPKS